MIEIKGLNKSFGRNNVLNNIDLSINGGKIYAVLGHNGSGKTTLIKSLFGLVVPKSGGIEVNGKSIKKDFEYKRGLAYISQIARFPQNLTVVELFSMISDLRSEKMKFDELVDLFDIRKELNKKLGHLSGGTRQKVNVVSALMIDAAVLVCDEPTVGLDPSSLVKLKKLLVQEREKGKTIILITHIISLVEELADEVFLLQDGYLNFSGTVDELKKQEGDNNLEMALVKMMEHIEHG